MRAPMSWLREYVALPPTISASDAAAALVRQGLEVEGVEDVSPGLKGPLVLARVLTIEELTEFKKPIRWVSVDADEGEPRWMICGARNFNVGDLVIVVLPGAVLPGNFEITARETYGRVSDGMICSAKELALSDDHSGIIVLPDDTGVPGDNAIELLGLNDQILDVAVTPDRGYALAMRGLARELATAFGVDFRDPADMVALPPLGDGPREVRIEDPGAADRIVLRTVQGFDPKAATPWWMRRRIEMSGMRAVSLAVDITNYVMLELGQPLHAFDDEQLKGPIRVRAADKAERLETLDHVMRDLAVDDAVIADDSGALALAGVMGGLTSEISETSNVTTIEAAHFLSSRIARTSRRHKLSSEASRRFERGVDSELGPIASARAVELLISIAGGEYVGGNEVDLRSATEPIAFDPGFASVLVGAPYSMDVVRRRLTEVGCRVAEATPWSVVPPTWRPDLTMPEDLVEEVARLEGYEHIPSLLPASGGGRGLTPAQRLRRRVGMTLAARGAVEVLTYPFVGEPYFDQAGYPAGDARRRAVRLANPLSEEEPFLRTSLLSGLVSAAQKNLSRGSRDLLLFEIGSAFLPDEKMAHAPVLPVDRAPSADDLAALEAAIPRQPRHVALLGLGQVDRSGWWGKESGVDWRTALDFADVIVALSGLSIVRRAGSQSPWHPGRCAEYTLDGLVVGYAGELHPRVCEALALPARSIAVELNLDMLTALPRREAVELSTMPVATEDIALVVDRDVSAAEVEAILKTAAGELLDSIYLFDRYEGAQIEPGKVSLAFALGFRADDRTLTGEELAQIRARLVSAAEGIGARLR
jgi:phenylalanyl-tRNA synthetase beta chain